MVTYKKHNIAKEKDILINMAKSGQPKPSQKTAIGKSLSHFWYRTSYYDQEFVDIIKSIPNKHPTWYERPSKITARQKKNILLDMAKSGKERPAYKSGLGANLASYIYPCFYSYDPDFVKELDAIPNKHYSWCDPDIRVNKIKEKKQCLLELARSGQPLPAELRRSYNSYRQRSQSTFDPDFVKELEAIPNKHPSWDKRYISTKNRKEAILELAKSGQPKPIFRSPLGKCISNYTHDNCRGIYDPEFRKQLEAIPNKHPSWNLK